MDGNHIEFGFTASARCWGFDNCRARSAKALWLVRWAWPHQMDAGNTEPGLQARAVVDDPGDSGRIGRRPLPGIWFADTAGGCGDLRCYVYCDFQIPLEKRPL